MGQQEILDWLEKQSWLDWFTSRQISKGTDIGYSSTVHCLKRLRLSNEIVFKEKERKEHPSDVHFLYKSKPIGGNSNV